MINIANGTSLLVTGIETVRLSGKFSLHNVLYVPSLSFNLLLVGKLPKDNNCITCFSSSKCWFQEKSMKDIIGIARNMEDFFLLKTVMQESTNLHSQLEESKSSRSSNDRMILVQMKYFCGIEDKDI